VPQQLNQEKNFVLHFTVKSILGETPEEHRTVTFYIVLLLIELLWTCSPTCSLHRWLIHSLILSRFMW